MDRPDGGVEHGGVNILKSVRHLYHGSAQTQCDYFSSRCVVNRGSIRTRGDYYFVGAPSTVSRYVINHTARDGYVRIVWVFFRVSSPTVFSFPSLESGGRYHVISP